MQPAPLQADDEVRMRWKTKNSLGHFSLCESLEIDAGAERVFALWSRYEDLPRVMDNVRRTQRIDERRVLWDIEIAGRQVVWEARILEEAPAKQVRWESSRGAANWGEVRFQQLPDGRTRLEVEIAYRPEGLLESLGARLALVDAHVRGDLERFRRFVERTPADPHVARVPADPPAAGHRLEPSASG